MEATVSVAALQDKLVTEGKNSVGRESLRWTPTFPGHITRAPDDVRFSASR